MKRSKRRIVDKIVTGAISLISLFGVIVLGLVLSFIVQRGYRLLSWEMITGDYYSMVYNAYYDGIIGESLFEKPANLDEEAYFSPKWGIALKDNTNFEGQNFIAIVHVDTDSPLTRLPDKNHEGITVSLFPGQSLDKVIFSDNTIILSRLGAESAIAHFENADGIADIIFSSLGSGIRGSLITTGYLILFTLLIALPLGVFSAVYLHEFAPKNKWYIVSLRRLIETLTGVPSIVYGLFGAALFIPFVSSVTGASGGNIISGALTLSIMVLPIIISATEDALKTIPDDFRQASLALGANRTQTTFKVVLRSATPGILSAALLSIGRIIGESAALIYAVGTAIKDKIIITEKSTSLAVFIWSVMSGENPNFELASTVAIIIMIFVLVLNIGIKLIAKQLSFKQK